MRARRKPGCRRQQTGVFAALKAPVVLAQVYIEEGAVAWPGDLDLAPDAMTQALRNQGEWVLR